MKNKKEATVLNDKELKKATGGTESAVLPDNKFGLPASDNIIGIEIIANIDLNGHTIDRNLK